ncbi:MAG: hypothetical protein JOY67_07075 [Hyphomicrobiales bacterium]|nr:hypothetical protein [Hyphomicrobiales bacterium]MBV9112566.1 hypothetical protein [Hyphomicrobiales bacterium]MBV9517596.1 hypothetical protein [Hyphomicrobiales bacterium]
MKRSIGGRLTDVSATDTFTPAETDDIRPETIPWDAVPFDAALLEVASSLVSLVSARRSLLIRHNPCPAAHGADLSCGCNVRWLKRFLEIARREMWSAKRKRKGRKNSSPAAKRCGKTRHFAARSCRMFDLQDKVNSRVTIRNFKAECISIRLDCQLC